MMTSVKLSNLPADVQQILHGMSYDDFHDLAREIKLQRTLAAQEALPTDPREAIEGIFEVYKLKDAPTNDCATETLVNLLTIFRLVFSAAESSGDGIDATDCHALWKLADQGHELARIAREQRYRAMEHCRAVKFAPKK